ncbi:WD40 repeat-like protein [Auriscalpium vulgare]|uniref:WD40 repeat-like protein n=1 Tax=Auriscalpium vulgare TaxID=40419 RepID=A0ACB8RUM6_9AGAM|nr:WD40 repeat-like protein [Auriscalpium vulgare]
MNPQGGAIPPPGTGNAPKSQAKASSCKCSAPPGGKSRNLVVCIDGTANQFSMKNTNVVELYSRLANDAEQLTYYNSGIGTFVKESRTSPAFWKQTINHGIDTAIAWNFKRIVLSAYQWLCENYEPGDRIFLYGFSRGAYQVRVIAGMIEKVGLLRKGNNDQIPFAYELYMATTSSQKRSTSASPPAPDKESKIKSPKDTGYAEQLCSRFKQTLSRENVRVHFVGVWDTVSSIGFARGKSLPETTTGMLHVCVFRHALSLDEKRAKFQPEYVNGGSGPREEDHGKCDCKEVWFAGSHSDVGGGNISNLTLDQFGAALRWMSYESISHGLRMAPFQGSQWQSFQPNPSLTWKWAILEILCFGQLSYKYADSTTHRPHLGRARQVKAGQMIHESVFEIIEHGDYEPFARLPGDIQAGWNRKALSDLNMLEGDAYASAAITLSQLKSATENNRSPLSPEHQNTLATLASSGTHIGRDSLATTRHAGDILFRALVVEHAKGGADPKQRRLNVAVLAAAILVIRRRPPAAKGFEEARLLELVSVLSDSPEDVKLRAEFVGLCLRGQIKLCRGHEDDVNSVAFSPDGKHIASGSSDETIRIWDVHTGESVAGPFAGHTAQVMTVAFSPDGQRIFSGSCDSTIRIWDAQTGETVVGPFTGPTIWVWSVAFSPDGRRVVSGSNDWTVRIQDAQTRETAAGPMTPTGHRGWVWSVAFSPDGKRVVSGSFDETIGIWDAQTGEPVESTFTGHIVLSVAFSPDGKRIVSGSADKKIRIWDAQTGKMVAGPFTGHRNWVMSVAFSPDGKRVVSGSRDKTIRVWDAHTGAMVVGPLRGHTGGIWSVVYSPDGKLVASGSKDGTVRIWGADVDDAPEN